MVHKSVIIGPGIVVAIYVKLVSGLYHLPDNFPTTISRSVGSQTGQLPDQLTCRRQFFFKSRKDYTVWLSGVVVTAFDLRLEIAGSIPAAALSSATLDKLFTCIVQHL